MGGDASRAELSRSRRIMLRANLVKLLVLAAAVPAATVGIAQRATALVGSEGEAALVGVVGVFGSLGGIAGAVVFGLAADARGGSERRRWTVVLLSSLIAAGGAAWMALVSTPWELAGSWMVLQWGVAGASAVLRALLTHALPAQRRRGAAAMVAFTYLGVGLPLVVLLLLPRSVWATAVVFGVLAVLAALVTMLRRRAEPSGAEDDAVSGGGPDDPASAEPVRDADRLPWALLVSAQWAFHLVMAAYLSYHSLDVAARFEAGAEGQWGDATVRVSVLALLAALAGLLAAAIWAIVRPAMLERALPLLAGTGVVLAVTISLRGLTDAVLVLVALLLLSGAGVGLSASVLLTAALEAGPRARAGRRIGVYSAVTAVGQLLGPLLGLGLIAVLGDYRGLYLALGLVPLLWTAWALAVIVRRRRVTPTARAG